MIKWSRPGVVLGLLVLCDGMASFSNAQNFERNTKITGPRGRSIDRQVDIERGPGTYSRQVQVQRPGGTIDRSTTIQRGWGGFPGGGFGGFRPLPFFPGPRPVTSFGLGITAAPMITIPFFAGGAAFGGGGGGAGGPGMGVAGGGGGGPGGAPGGQPAQAGQPNPLDPVVLAAQKLQSFHYSSRRDGARELGQLGDPRGIPPLVHTLKYDSSKEVRAAAATSLGELGGSDAEVVLERCIIYEKKQEVKDAAASALRLLRERRAADPQAGQSPQPLTRSAAPTTPYQTQQSDVPRLTTPLPAPVASSSPFRSPPATQQPPLDGPSADAPAPSDGDRVPPPPPSPVGPH